MSFIDDFIYKVKTGRLFAGFEKQEETDKQVRVLESNSEILEKINRQIMELETKMEVLEEMDKEIMVLETKIEAFKETNRETADEENPVEKQEEINTEILPVEPQPVMQEKNEHAINEKAPVIQHPVKKQIGPDVIIHFVFMEKTYIVEKFNLNFQQDINTLRNRPDSFTYGGTMQISISGFLDSTLDEWLSQTYLLRSGEIHFFPNMPKITDSSLLTIFFTDAYCTACNKTMDAVTSGVLTTLTVAPRLIKIGNEEFANQWKKKEPLEFTIKSV